MDEHPEGASWANILGMAGNVWEWVNDWYANNYYGTSQKNNPTGPESGIYRVMRGGSWDFDKYAIRSTYRNILNLPHYTGYNVGFRCVGE